MAIWGLGTLANLGMGAGLGMGRGASQEPPAARGPQGLGFYAHPMNRGQTAMSPGQAPQTGGVFGGGVNTNAQGQMQPSGGVAGAIENAGPMGGTPWGNQPGSQNTGISGGMIGVPTQAMKDALPPNYQWPFQSGNTGINGGAIGAGEQVRPPGFTTSTGEYVTYEQLGLQPPSGITNMPVPRDSGIDYSRKDPRFGGTLASLGGVI